MRILTFTSLFPNSQAANHGIFLLQRTAHLARREGNCVQVVAPLPYVPKFLSGTSRGRRASIPDIETIGGLRVHHPRYALIPKISMPLHGLLMYAGTVGLMRKLHNEQPFDCIDAHYIFPDGVAAVMLGRSLGIPVALTARGTDIHTFPKFVSIRPQIRWALRQAAAVGAVSNSLAELMCELQASVAAVDVIGNGVDDKRFFREDRAAARRKLGLADQDDVIVSVAALRHVKGCDLLVRAAAKLKQARKNLKVLFVGQGEELPALQRLAMRLGCGDVCSFVGAVLNQELRYYFSAADVSCLPSRNEGWPNVILESLACGTPVVGTSVGAVPEILCDARMGIVVDPTPEAIGAGLRLALGRVWDRDNIARYAQSHTWDDVAERAEKFLRRSVPQELSDLHPALSA